MNMKLLDAGRNAVLFVATRLGAMFNSDRFKDWLLLIVTKISTKPFFRESVDTVSFEDHLKAVSFDLPIISGLQENDIDVETLEGALASGLKVLRWAGPDAPTLIYHHGGGEIPFNYTISKMYPPNESVGAVPLNVVVVKAPCQATHSEVREAFPCLATYLAMMSVPVAITEALIKGPFAKSRCIAVSGYSLGGFVTCRHHMLYNTADIYIPFMCGTRHAEIFLTTVHAGSVVHKNAEAFRALLNFEDQWKQRGHDNVFPVLGRNDLLNRLDMQLPSYGSMNVDIWEGGHLFGVSNPHKIRLKIEGLIQAFLADTKYKTL